MKVKTHRMNKPKPIKAAGNFKKSKGGVAPHHTHGAASKKTK